ncbi:hypothetical protein Aperf_G00000027436 [Anoplocephala perfoliata]
MSNSLGEECLEELREVFALFDRDHNGFMSLSELKTMMKQFNRACTTDEAKEIFSNLDKNHDGRIDFREFATLMQPLVEESKDEDFLQRIAFNFFDKDGDESITTAELKQVLRNLHLKLTDSEVDEMINEADLDRNGAISFDEFKKMMTKNRS